MRPLVPFVVPLNWVPPQLGNETRLPCRASFTLVGDFPPIIAGHRDSSRHPEPLLLETHSHTAESTWLTSQAPGITPASAVLPALGVVVDYVVTLAIRSVDHETLVPYAPHSVAPLRMRYIEHSHTFRHRRGDDFGVRKQKLPLPFGSRYSPVRHRLYVVSPVSPIGFGPLMLELFAARLFNESPEKSRSGPACHQVKNSTHRLALCNVRLPLPWIPSRYTPQRDSP